MNGCIYRTKDNECDFFAEGGKYTAFCDLENCNERKPSNGDRIRAMSDEELAEFMAEDFCELLCGSPCVCDGQCDVKLLKWLKMEANDDV